MITRIYSCRGLHYDLSHIPATSPRAMDVWQVACRRTGKRPILTWHATELDARAFVRDHLAAILSLQTLTLPAASTHARQCS